MVVSAAPAYCESDRDCLKGKAKCLRRECHCTDKYAFGDGKKKCERKCASCLLKRFLLYQKFSD